LGHAGEMTDIDVSQRRGLPTAPASSSLVSSARSVRAAGTHNTAGPIDSALGSVRRLFARHSRSFDVVLALGLAVLAVAGVRYIELAFVDFTREADKSKPMLEAVVRAGGENAELAKKSLEALADATPRLSVPALYALALLASIPLIWRRRYPGTACVIVVGACSVILWFSPADTAIPSITAWVAVYSLAAFGLISFRHRLAVLGALLVMLVLLVSGIVRNPDLGAELTNRDLMFGTALAILSYGSAIAFGLLTLRHRETVQELEHRGSLLAAQQDELARTAVLDERVRIARELHDVVAHHVSVMGMQAGAARLSLTASASVASAPISSMDGRVSDALSSIENSSRQAVSDLHRLLGFLRDEPSSTTVASPQPSIDAFPQLFEEHAASGLAVSARIGEGVAAVSPAVSLTAYRIVQEALTNARKHGAGSPGADVDLRIDGNCLIVEVCNDRGSESSGVPGAPGHGLLGMGERVALHGGSLDSGPTPTGFRVRAVLPLSGVGI
jgi:signal transduction histidine kinase